MVTAALIVVLSVFNGFEDLVQHLYADFHADITVLPAKGKWMKADSSLLARIQSFPGVEAAEPVLEERAILVQEGDRSIVKLKGVGPGYTGVSGVPRNMVRGQFALGNTDQPALCLGYVVEGNLRIIAGQTLAPVTVYLPNRLASNPADALSAFHSANAFASGSFSIQQDFDNGYAFTNLGFMRYMLDAQPSDASGLELAVAAQYNPEQVSAGLQRKLGKSFVVKTRYQQNSALFSAMKIEKLIIFFVAFLILLIAAFNIISSLSMIVLEKQRDISILMAMGMDRRRISNLFLKLAAVMGFTGGAIGFLAGTAICLGQRHFHWVKLGADSFIIDYYPVQLRAADYLGVGVVIAAIALIAGFLPARRASFIPVSLR